MALYSILYLYFLQQIYVQFCLELQYNINLLNEYKSSLYIFDCFKIIYLNIFWFSSPSSWREFFSSWRNGLISNLTPTIAVIDYPLVDIIDL